MDPRLKDLADAVAEALAKRWLEQERRLAGQKPKPGDNPQQPSVAGQKKPRHRGDGTRKHRH